MNLPNLHNIFNKEKGSKGVRKFSPDDILVWGTVAAGLLFIGFLAFDGIIFYRTYFEKDPTPEAKVSQKMLSQKDFLETIQRLDHREKTFKELSKPIPTPTPPPTIRATSTATTTATTTPVPPFSLLLP